MTSARFIEWQKETGKKARGSLEQALAAARAGDVPACAAAARAATAVFLRAYVEVAGIEQFADEEIMDLFEAAVGQDPCFARVRAQAQLLAAAGRDPSQGDCEAIVDAMKEIRLLAGACGGVALGFSNRPPDGDPCLERFVVHSTTAERARSIFAHGALYSYNQCVSRGLLSGPAPGVKYLLDPRRCTDLVMFGISEHRYYAGEKVANAHRKGWIDEGLDEDYEPSVRLFFRKDELEALPGCEHDGIHELMIRDAVSLEHLAYAVFPTSEAREAALAALTDPARKERLQALCLVASPECRRDPRTYVAATNALVVESARVRK